MNAVDLIEVDVTFRTEDGFRRALNHLNLHIKAGQWCTIIGENGCGKSTLAKVIANLSPISKGNISMMGESPKHGKDSYVQMVFQNPDAQIIGETVFEDIAFGLGIRNTPTERIPDTVRATLAQFGLEDWFDKPISVLSGGQKQLLCIMSCIALEPDIIVFDECTSMLDEGARQIVRNAARYLVLSGKTVIWITHHLDELADADEVVVMESGQVVFQGTPQAFFYENRFHENSESWCRKLGFTPPYVIQIAEQLRMTHGWSWFMPLTVSELFQGERNLCPSS